MTATETTVPGPAPASLPADAPDRRRSPVPTFGMIRSRITELRKRRGLMATLILVTIGLPVFFLALRLILHAAAPKTYGPAGGYEIYVAMTSGVLYTFGFIVAAALGATAGSSDLTEGVFRHEVVTGRSRLALYLARIPAGLAIIGTLVAVGFALVCAVCVFAAPTHLHYDGVSVPGNLSRSGLEDWAAAHPEDVICRFDFRIEASSSAAPVVGGLCRPPGGPKGDGGPRQGTTVETPATTAQVQHLARLVASRNYAAYHRQFLSPPTSLMVDSFLWLELEVLIGFIVGLGLGSLTGQRTATVIMMIILEVVLTPILSRVHIPHMINLQRAVVGLATAHLAPGRLRVLGGGADGGSELIPEAKAVAVVVIAAWLIGWTIIGAWRMCTRDA